MPIDEECIIINKMFVGDYLSMGVNIGHEIINFFSTDQNNDQNDGQQFLYLAPHGIIGDPHKKYDGKVEAVFLTRQFATGMQQVIGIAEIEEQILKKSEKLSIEEQLSNFAKNNKVTYGGYSLNKIFGKNQYPDENNKKILKRDDIPGKLTFSVKKFYIPKDSKQIILTDSAAKEYEIETFKSRNKFVVKNLSEKDHDFKFGGSGSQCRYFSNIDTADHPKVYEALKTILNERKKYFKEYKPPKVGDPEIKEKRKSREESVSYLEVMSQLDRETIFSNLFKFFLEENPNLMQKFCQDILEIKDFDSREAAIKREHFYSDIWIEDPRHIIVIENKINAEIIKGNSKEKDSKQNEGQLQRYYDSAVEVREGTKPPLVEERDGRKKEIHLFLMAPDYRQFRDDDLKVMGEDNKEPTYKIIKYSKIEKEMKDYNIAKGIRGSKKYKTRIKDYFDDFMRAVSSQSGSVNLRNQEAMERRFFNILDELDDKRKK